jgi:hypothetical protein
MNAVSLELIEVMNQSFSMVCEKDRLEVVYLGADRHAVVEWLARAPAGSLPDPTHAGYAALAAWVDDLGDVIVEAWSGISTEDGALRELAWRGPWGQSEVVEPQAMYEPMKSLVELCLYRSARISNQRSGRPLAIQFVTSRGGDESRPKRRDRGPDKAHGGSADTSG